MNVLQTLPPKPGGVPRIAALLMACGVPVLAAAQSTAPGAGSLLKELTPPARACK